MRRLLGASLLFGVITGALGAVTLLRVREPQALSDLAGRVEALENRLASLQESGGRAAADFSPSEGVRQLLPERAEVDLTNVATRGNARASVSLIEFTDPQCPYCGRYARETFDRVDDAFVKTGQVLYALRYFPLESIHPFAFKASESLECARDQGRVWQLHRSLFEKQEVAPASLFAQAKDIGMDMMRFEDCMSGPAAQRVRQDLADGARLGVRSTPTFLIASRAGNGRWMVQERLVGARSFEALKASLAATLSGLRSSR